jgi:hypothetical protein
VILPLAFGVAHGQPLRSVVVPADAPVAVPPRGQPLPPRIGMPSGVGAPPAAGVPTVPVGVGVPAVPAGVAPAAVPANAAFAAALPMGLAAAPGLLLPLAASTLLGGALAGGGGSGTGAPAVTR